MTRVALMPSRAFRNVLRNCHAGDMPGRKHHRWKKWRDRFFAVARLLQAAVLIDGKWGRQSIQSYRGIFCPPRLLKGKVASVYVVNCSDAESLLEAEPFGYEELDVEVSR